jgi:epoxide hydrolase
VNITPFRIDIPQSDLDDLADRLARTRFTDDAAPAYGIPVADVRRLVEYWRTGYDWRAWEARFNEYPQFTTEIDGQSIHFLHMRSPEPNALPLIVTHGWPGSFVEFLDVIGPLSDPRAHGLDPAVAFDLVIPSLPGFAFSGPTTEPDWGTARTARAWVGLMQRIGYQRYGAIGNDGGSMVSPEVGRLDPEHVVGAHVTQVFSFPTGDPAEFEGMTPDELEGMKILQWFWEEKGAFNTLHSQQPQTLAHALADSPAGLLAWNGQLLMEDMDDDFVLTNVAIYWLTATAGSAIRYYYDDAKASKTAQPAEPTTVPLGLAAAKSGDFRSIRRFADRDHKNIVSWNTIDATGHYTAHTAPNAYVDDVRQFFAGLS